MSENQYKVFCINEQESYTIWSEKTPITCPNDYRHNIDPLQTVKIQSRYKDVQNVQIQQEKTLTNGNYKYKSFKFPITQSGESQFNISFNYPINVLQVHTNTGEIHRGDKINVSLIPYNPIIGSLASNVSIGDSNLYVTNNVLNYINQGYITILKDNITQLSENLGETYSIDTSNNKIITQYCASNNYSAASPTTVAVNVEFIEDMYITEPLLYTIGNKKITTSFIPSKATVQITYSNAAASNNIEKDFIISLEYMY